MTVAVDKAKCTGLGKCVEVCPVNAMKVVGGKVEVVVVVGAELAKHGFDIGDHGFGRRACATNRSDQI